MPTEKPVRASGVSAAYQPPPLTPVEIKPPRRGVSAAEKYSELEARGEERPRCKCHGEPKSWAMAVNRRAGGQWKCQVKRRARNRKYEEANREKQQEKARRFRATRLSQGLCSQCGKEPLATASSWRCNKCLDELVSPERLLKNRRYTALKRMEKRHQTGRI